MYEFDERGLGTASAKLFADYWFSLPKTDLIPSRRDFDALDVWKMLPNFVMHDMIGPDNIRVRLVGTDVVARYGYEITGKNYLDIIPPETRAHVSERLFQIINRPCGMVVHLRQTRNTGSAYINESVGFPLRGNDGKASIVVYQANTLYDPIEFEAEPGPLINMRAQRRRYIDIGAGTPDIHAFESWDREIEPPAGPKEDDDDADDFNSPAGE